MPVADVLTRADSDGEVDTIGVVVVVTVVIAAVAFEAAMVALVVFVIGIELGKVYWEQSPGTCVPQRVGHFPLILPPHKQKLQ